MMKLNMKTIKLAVKEHNIQLCSFFCALFFFSPKIQHIKNDKKNKQTPNTQAPTAIAQDAPQKTLANA